MPLSRNGSKMGCACATCFCSFRRPLDLYYRVMSAAKLASRALGHSTAMKIDGRTIDVTGASRGIGKSAAEALARAGGRVALIARSPEIEQVAAAIAGGQARGYVADLGNAAEVSEVSQRIVKDLGAPDIVVNNAGAGRWLHIEETPPEEAEAMMAAPYFAAFYVTRAFLPAMLQRGSGTIVNINSPVAWLPWPGAIGYSAARWAMRGFNEALRMDLRGTG